MENKNDKKTVELTISTIKELWSKTYNTDGRWFVMNCTEKSDNIRADRMTSGECAVKMRTTQTIQQGIVNGKDQEWVQHFFMPGKRLPVQSFGNHRPADLFPKIKEFSFDEACIGYFHPNT